MRIYKLERKPAFEATHDQMRDCIVVADSAGQARALAEDAEPDDEELGTWLSAAKTTCRGVGYGLRGAQPGLLCRDVLEG